MLSMLKSPHTMIGLLNILRKNKWSSNFSKNNLTLLAGGRYINDIVYVVPVFLYLLE